MDEDLLSPLLGRLIDRAKAAALEGAPESGEAEGIALLLADETVVAAGSPIGQQAGRPSAAALALAIARADGGTPVEAVAIAMTGAELSTAPPSARSRDDLAALDEALPVVLKHRGRWVVRLLCELPERAESA